MTDNLGTELDNTSAPTAEARTKARRYLESTGNADLLDMLGLVDAKPRERAVCPACKQQYYPGRRDCRSRSCELGPASRKAKR
jgi:hypothetical protein